MRFSAFGHDNSAGGLRGLRRSALLCGRSAGAHIAPQEGGCRLKADLNELSLYDLMRCINEDIFVNACMDSEYECPWRRSHCGMCRFHSSLEGVQGEIEELLKRNYIGNML